MIKHTQRFSAQNSGGQMTQIMCYEGFEAQGDCEEKYTQWSGLYIHH